MLFEREGPAVGQPRQETSNAGERPARGRSRPRRLLKLVRRVHMFAGLVLLPWLFVFGLSGVLFNHPNIGEEVHGRALAESELGSTLPRWEPTAIAREVVDRLNARSERATHYALDATLPAELTGFTALTAPANDGQHLLLLDMEKPAGLLITRKARPVRDDERFERTNVVLPTHSTKQIEQRLAGLLEAQGVAALTQLRAHPKIAPELRFRVRDDDGRSWNVSYDLGSGALSGRLADAWPDIGLAQLLTKLHTTHHFPMRLGALWFWALFQDLLGIAMVVWALSGLLMWWQMKPTRRYGIISIALALLVAGCVIGGTAAHLTFGDVRQQIGPGE